MISVTDVFFSQVSNDVDSFSEICFLREIECERVFEGENGKFRKNFLHHWKAKEKIRRKRLSNNFFKYISYHKHELEIARFGARATRAGAVNVKRLTCAFLTNVSC